MQWLLRVARNRRSDTIFALVVLLSITVLFIGGDQGDALQGLFIPIVCAPLYFWTEKLVSAPSRARDWTVVPNHRLAGGFIVLYLAQMTWELASRGGNHAATWLDDWHWRLSSFFGLILHFKDLETVNAVVTLVIVPSALLLLLNWRFPNVGIDRSSVGTTRALILWCSLPTIMYIVAVITAHATASSLLSRFLVSFFRSGFSEELFFRGIVLSIAAKWFGIARGNIAQAVLFGIWHLGANLHDVNGNVALALADGFATQASFGYFLGLLRIRTGNILLSSVLHALLNTASVLH